ncbi:MAG: hypothetical protein EBZ51_10000 [Synechococcaceae bacterium WB9_2_112]|nr:hypothetical protein [Synechococcaceae bacterium WB9_2_112]
MSGLPGWLQRWNFIERARHERSLWEAFERGENLEQLVAELSQQVQVSGAGEQAFQLEVWQATLPRIRKIETMMRQRPEQR